MTKQELLVKISELLDNAIAIHEVTDLKLETNDRGALNNINNRIEDAIMCLRDLRRFGRVLLEEYEDDLTKKPEYADLIMAIDEDEDEDEDEEE